jgi:hypothetical protein
MSANCIGERGNSNHNQVTMKPIFALLLALTVSASLVLAADVKITKVSTGPEAEAATTFATDASEIFAIFKTEGISAGDKVRGVLIAEDVGDAAPANTKVLEKSLTLKGDTEDGDFSFSKPTNGWPPGKYRIEIYVNDELGTKTKFLIGGDDAGKKKPEESAEIPDKSQLESMTEKSLVSFGRAVKKKDFTAFYEDIAGLWQKQTTPEKLQDAFKDFFDKEIDLPAAIKGKQPVFNQQPTINSDGVLIIKGYYPTTPNRIVFQLKYLNEEGEWKVVGVNVNLKE